MDDNVRILTLPYTNDLYAVHNSANNLKVLVILVAHYLIIVDHKLDFQLCFSITRVSSES
ncbi:hypothetical protein QR98_0053710 [Sarcoptes scabiei]|uniref:Uncharacterized protein n=1 Tax=Sarcoptes scabiei TaxID=52283 RepID=A0A132A7E1_SARSC|nr:hypothetical protein QR98_0053710 [Sarcoptes scabiei]